MEDRLASALDIVINNTKDEKLKKTLQLVLQLDQDINIMDYTDWEEYKGSHEFNETMRQWFEEVET